MSTTNDPNSAEELRARHEALLAEAEAAGVDDIRVITSRADLGGGLEAATARYYDRNGIDGPLTTACDVELFRLGGLELEIDTSTRGRGRRVFVVYGDGKTDGGTPAAELLQLLNLIGRPEVNAALERWAAEDAAAGEEGGRA